MYKRIHRTLDEKNKGDQKMDKTEVINIAEQFASVVMKKYDCAGIILFGSYAKNNYRTDSDIDVAVILKNYDKFMNIQLELMRLRRKIDSRIEPHLFKISDFNDNNPLVHEIKKFGEKININVA